MTPRVATEDSFATEVLKFDGEILVDFSATWCEPCRMLAPVLEEAAAQLQLPLVRVDTDANPEVTAAAEIESVPTVVVYRRGIALARLVGARPKPQLLAELSEILVAD